MKELQTIIIFKEIAFRGFAKKTAKSAIINLAKTNLFKIRTEGRNFKAFLKEVYATDLDSVS